MGWLLFEAMLIKTILAIIMRINATLKRFGPAGLALANSSCLCTRPAMGLGTSDEVQALQSKAIATGNPGTSTACPKA